MTISLETKLELIQLYYKHSNNLTLCMRAFKKKNNVHNNSLTLTAIKRVVDYFEATKSIHPISSPRRPSMFEERFSIDKASLTELQNENLYIYIDIIIDKILNFFILSLTLIDIN